MEILPDILQQSAKGYIFIVDQTPYKKTLCCKIALHNTSHDDGAVQGAFSISRSGSG